MNGRSSTSSITSFRRGIIVVAIDVSRQGAHAELPLRARFLSRGLALALLSVRATVIPPGA